MVGIWRTPLCGRSGCEARPVGRHRDNVMRLPPLETMVKVDGRVSRARLLRESRRASVLAVARKIFSQKGYHDTSIDDLIEAAGIARGTFYLYFESKRAIFEVLLDELFGTLASSVRRIDVAAGAPPPLEQVGSIVDRIFATLDENRDLAR